MDLSRRKGTIMRRIFDCATWLIAPATISKRWKLLNFQVSSDYKVETRWLLILKEQEKGYKKQLIVKTFYNIVD